MRAAGRRGLRRRAARARRAACRLGRGSATALRAIGVACLVATALRAAGGGRRAPAGTRPLAVLSTMAPVAGPGSTCAVGLVEGLAACCAAPVALAAASVQASATRTRKVASFTGVLLDAACPADEGSVPAAAAGLRGCRVCGVRRRAPAAAAGSRECPLLQASPVPPVAAAGRCCHRRPCRATVPGRSGTPEALGTGPGHAACAGSGRHRHPPCPDGRRTIGKVCRPLPSLPSPGASTPAGEPRIRGPAGHRRRPWRRRLSRPSRPARRRPPPAPSSRPPPSRARAARRASPSRRSPPRRSRRRSG